MNDFTSQSLKGKARQNYYSRRGAPRFDASAIPSLKSINQVGGPEIKLINISRGGALIESQEPLSKGSNICLRLVTAKNVYLLKGRIIRFSASSMNGNVLQYQSAIIFDEDFTILPSNRVVEEIHEGAQVELTEISAT